MPSPQSTPTVKGGTPPQQSGEDELIKLADEIALSEDIPIEVAWEFVRRHYSSFVKEARYERAA